jgi:hypothetical protein
LTVRPDDGPAIVLYQGIAGLAVNIFRGCQGGACEIF